MMTYEREREFVQIIVCACVFVCAGMRVCVHVCVYAYLHTQRERNRENALVGRKDAPMRK